MSDFTDGYRTGWDHGYRMGQNDARRDTLRYAQSSSRWASNLPLGDRERALIDELERRANPPRAVNTSD